MKIVFCIYGAFEINLRIKNALAKSLKESYRLSYEEQFFLNYFVKDYFVTKYYQNNQAFLLPLA